MPIFAVLPTLVPSNPVAPFFRNVPYGAAYEPARLLHQMRRAPTLEVRHVDGERILSSGFFRGDDERPDGASRLLRAIETVYIKRPNELQVRCPFQADLVVAYGRRTLKAELCFGCSAVRVTIPNGSELRLVYWVMSDPKALKAAAWTIYPGIELGPRR